MSEIVAVEEEPLATLLVDAHEPDNVFNNCVSYFKPKRIAVKRTLSEVGDFFLGDKLGVESKTPRDFRNSLVSGRLMQQARELSENFQLAAVIVKGDMDALANSRDNGWNPASLYGAVASLYKHGVPVWFVGEYGLEHALHALVNQVMKEPGVDNYTPIRREAKTEDYGQVILASFPKVGPTKAKALLTHFGSVKNACLNIEKWSEVDGVGEGIKTKAGIVWEGGAL